MNHFLLATMVAVALLGTGHSAQADVCGQMARLSGDWLTLKNYIDANDDDGLNAAEIQYISREEHRLIVPTIRMMAEAMNDPRPQARAQALRLNADLTRLDQIDDDNDWVEDSRIIFRLARDLAELSRTCQMAAQPAGHCEQLIGLAQHWQALGTYIDRNDDDGLNLAESQYISREEHRLIVPTLRLITQASVDPRPPVRNLAMRLNADLQRLDQIDDDGDWTEDSQLIFRIAREIMRFGGVCQGGM